MSGGGIYLVRDGDLVEMTEEPFEDEDLFQKLLAKYPRVLGGDQLDGSVPKRWLLVSREAGIPDVEDGADRWSVDHLFVDDEAIPTFVEVKRKSDTRLRREVVGQMLDYASHAAKNWTTNSIREVFETQCGEADPSQVLADGLGETLEADVFWSQVGANLKSGTIRMVFVAEQFPPELRRVVEFLNEQMTPAEVIGIEIRQYVGEGLQTLVPHVIGLTQSGGTGRGKRWDSESFFADLAARPEASAIEGIARELLDFGKRVSDRGVDWGTGQGWGSFTAAVRVGRERFSLFSVYSTGHFSMNIGWSAARHQEMGMSFSEELREKINGELGLQIDRDTWEHSQTKTELSFFSSEKLALFERIIEEVAAEIRKRAPQFLGM